MTTKAKACTLFSALIAIIALGASMMTFPISAHGLETNPYTPGENYYIEEEEAFRNQDIEHEEALENSASTSYYLTSAFYLEWISPDMTIYEGEEAYIGCGATGLEDLHYEWQISTDGGQTFSETGLVGNEHTLTGLTANNPESQPYLYRCTITNGDRTSTLTADVYVTVLKADATPEPGTSPVQTGDNLAKILSVLGCLAFISGIILLPAAILRKKEREYEEAMK